jgi:hypothetical protein
MTNKHLGEIDSAEPTGASCPICERAILKLSLKNGQTYLACKCAAIEWTQARIDYARTLDSAIPFITGECWAEEIADLMQNYPDQFPAGSVPGPI